MDAPKTASTLQFSEISYQRIDLERVTNQIRALLEQFQKAESSSERHRLWMEINDIRRYFSAMMSLAHIRHTINTKDEFYASEHQYYDSVSPAFQNLENECYQALLNLPHAEQLREEWGEQIFRIAECTLKTVDDAVIPGLQEENRLITEFIRHKASAKIEFRGESFNLSSIKKLEEDRDRTTRREAGAAKWAFYQEKGPVFDDIFDKLVKRRHRVARQLGFDNFVGLAYNRLLRSDYGPEEVAVVRQQIAEEVVPIAQTLIERQQRRLGVEQLHYYDRDYCFRKGNPQPQGDPQWIVEQAERMYQELSPETDRFFSFMQEHQLMDLINKENKATGGYCAFLPVFNLPFIFSNFNGSSSDIDVLTHEAGHAFQLFNSSDQPFLEYIWPTFEACEIHSMSMEFFTRPWMQLFFGDDTPKYLFDHLASTVQFLPYGSAVDEFQHRIYENPDLTPDERHEVWLEMEEKYLPHFCDEEAPEYLRKGGFWHRQTHIFARPFYYIDYVLAQICALQFWKRSEQDPEKAWSDYLHLCKLGGSKCFLELVDEAGLQSPFYPKVITDICSHVQAVLNDIDDLAFDT